MRGKLLGALAISAALLFSGCAETKAVAPVKKEMTAPSAKVAKLIKKFDLKVVDYAYAKAAVNKGTRKGAKAVFIDARPAKMYAKSTIPSSLNVPDTQFDKFVGQLDKVKKDKEIIVYCGGWKCGKSPKVAGMLKAKGFTNVKLYQAGEPEWKKKNYVEVSTAYVNAAVKAKAVIIDARPAKMFAKSSVPSSISIPDTKFDKFVGQVEGMDKATELITYCGGYNCGKSHKVAKLLMKKGFKNVKVYAGGLPAWKKAGKPMAGKAMKKMASKPMAVTGMVAGIKTGADEGTVDGEWYKAQLKMLPTHIQAVDVRSADEFAEGHLAGAINIEAGEMSPADFVAKLPKGKTIVFNCSAGARSMEAWEKAKDGKADMSKIYYFDANIDCTGTTCTIEVNEPLG